MDLLCDLPWMSGPDQITSPVRNGPVHGPKLIGTVQGTIFWSEIDGPVRGPNFWSVFSVPVRDGPVRSVIFPKRMVSDRTN